MAEKLVNTKELCEHFGVTRQAVEQWRKNGLPTIVDKPNGTKRYLKSAVIRWLNRRATISKRKGRVDSPMIKRKR